MPTRAVRISKFLALVLRHDPGRIGLTLDAEGWADVDELLAAAARHGLPISRPELEQVVRTNPKQRFTLDGAANRIRAAPCRLPATGCTALPTGYGSPTTSQRNISAQPNSGGSELSGDARWIGRAPALRHRRFRR